MADQEGELCIPFDRIPKELVNQLRELGRLLQSEAAPVTSAAASSPAVTQSIDNDECDNHEQRDNSVVHVLPPVPNPSRTSHDSDVVSVLNPFPTENPFTFGMRSQESINSDVVSVLASSPSRWSNPRPTTSESNEGTSRPRTNSQEKTPGSYHPSPQYSSPPPVGSPVAAASPIPQQSTPVKAKPEEEERRCLRSEPGSHRLERPLFSCSPSADGPPTSPPQTMTSAALTSLPSHSSPVPARSRPLAVDMVRVCPPGSDASPDAGAQRSPRILTPPETPESERKKRAKPEIFTFDEFTVAQERLRQNKEMLLQLQETFTPPKRTPCPPPSTPPVRRQEMLRCPPLTPSRRVSPIDQCLLDRLELNSASPRKKRSMEVPLSPIPHPTPNRSLSAEEYGACHRRGSGSPMPRKRLEFESETSPSSSSSTSSVAQFMHRTRSLDHVSSYPVLHPSASDEGFSFPASSPRLPTTPSEPGFSYASSSPRPSDPEFSYPTSSPRPSTSSDPRYSYPSSLHPPPSVSDTGFSYPSSSPRPSNSGSEAGFPFSLYGMEFPGFCRGAPTTPKSAGFAEFQERVGRVECEDEGEDRMSWMVAGLRGLVEPGEYGRLALHASRAAFKRKRPEIEMGDGNDDTNLCSCAVMERNFLQMSECAYKGIRRNDNSTAEFHRFYRELTQTNSILSESMVIIKHIQKFCDHRKRPRW